MPAKQWTGPDWVTAIATVMIFITTAVYTYYARRQWQEMKASGGDTHDLAVSAGKQADFAKTQSQQAIAQTEKMTDLVEKATAQAKATNDLAGQAKRSADIADQALKSSVESGWQDRRPWVGLQGYQCNSCSETADYFTVGSLMGVMANTGRTPAVRMVVYTTAEIGVPKDDPVPDWDSMERDSERRFEEMMKRMPPNAPPDVKASIAKSIETTKRDMSIQVVLAPGATQVLKLLGKTNIGRPKDIRARFETVHYVVGKITYYETRLDSKQHTTKFCLINDFGSDFHFCSSGNWLD
jgi:hypothetical protein